MSRSCLGRRLTASHTSLFTSSCTGASRFASSGAAISVALTRRFQADRRSSLQRLTVQRISQAFKCSSSRNATETPTRRMNTSCATSSASCGERVWLRASRYTKAPQASIACSTSSAVLRSTLISSPPPSPSNMKHGGSMFREWGKGSIIRYGDVKCRAAGCWGWLCAVREGGPRGRRDPRHAKRRGRQVRCRHRRNSAGAKRGRRRSSRRAR